MTTKTYKNKMEGVEIDMANKNTKTTNKINKQKEFEQKKRKKRKLILITAIIMIVIALICIYLFTSESFKINEIIIVGNEQLTSEEICQLSEIKTGDNIFATLEIVTRVKLKQNGYIEDVKLKKIYPNKLEIEIKERKKEFQIKTDSGVYIYIDQQGYILDYSLDKLELITIIGMETTENEVEIQKRISEKDLNKMENILQIQEEAKKIEIADKITQIQVEDEYIVSLQNDEVIVNLGDATNLKNRMFYVKAILKKEAGNSGIIYVNGNLNEGFTPYFSQK